MKRVSQNLREATAPPCRGAGPTGLRGLTPTDTHIKYVFVDVRPLRRFAPPPLQGGGVYFATPSLLTFRKMSERDACGCRIPATVRRRTEIREYPRLAERHSVTKTALFPSFRHHAPPPLRMASPAASAIPPQTRQSVSRILHASALLPEEKTHPKPRFSGQSENPVVFLLPFPILRAQFG